MGFKRVNVLLTEEQYQWVHERDLSLSGLVRDLLNDRFSNTKIVLSVPQEVRTMYDRLISNFGVSDQELAPYMVDALEHFLAAKLEELEVFKNELVAAKKKMKD